MRAALEAAPAASEASEVLATWRGVTGDVDKEAAELAEITGEGAAVDFGSQDRNYVLQPYQQVKDLRSGLELSNPDAVLDGELEELMESYLQWVRTGGPATG